MTEREALKLALKALETNNKAWKHLVDSGDAGFWEAEEQPFYELSVQAITAIKEALAQPNFCPRCGKRLGTNDWDIHTCTPPQRKPLTDEEITDAVRESDLDWHQGWTLDDDEPNRFISLARAIEAAHGIKE